MKSRLTLEDFEFPEPALQVVGKWSPIFFEPILGSGERLAVGIVVFSEAASFVFPANKLSRLQCLYGDRAAWVIDVVAGALEWLKDDVAVRGIKAYQDPASPISGISFSELKPGGAESWSQFVDLYLGSASSLHARAESRRAISTVDEVAEQLESIEKANREKLPVLVANKVINRHPSLQGFFRSELRLNNPKKTHAKGHRVNIDFAGSKIVANFCTLPGARSFKSAEYIKTRLWDLAIDRDRSPLRIQPSTAHEMFVFRPSLDDPNFSEKQQSNIGEVLAELEEQADKEEIRLRPFTTVDQMADRIVNAELV